MNSLENFVPFIGSEASAINDLSSSSGDKYCTSFVISYFLPFLLIVLYGDSIKPKLLTTAWVAKELIKPMFGPSGVSIGQSLP